MSKTSILFLSADPSDAARLRVGQEIREVRERLSAAVARNRFELHERSAVRVQDLTQAIFDTAPSVVHFSGHGSGSTGGICLEAPDGTTQTVGAQALESLFARLADSVDCVVLNACFSRPQAEAIANHVRYVVGMSNAISDDSAIAFSVGFYKALLAGRSFEDAFGFGTVELELLATGEHSTPVLLVNPDLRGRLEHRRVAHHWQSPRSPDRVSIRRLASDGRRESAYDWILLDPGARQTVGDVLGEVYLDSLTRIVSPYSYGREWILESGKEGAGRLLAPAAWSVAGHVWTEDCAPGWQAETAPADAGLTRGTVWRIRRLEPIEFPMPYVGILSRDRALLDELAQSPKRMYASGWPMRRFGAVKASEIDKYPDYYSVVLDNIAGYGEPGMLYVDE